MIEKQILVFVISQDIDGEEDFVIEVLRCSDPGARSSALIKENGDPTDFELFFFEGNPRIQLYEGNHWEFGARDEEVCLEDEGADFFFTFSREVAEKRLTILKEGIE